MSEINIAPGKLNVGAVFSQALATLQSKLLFFVFTGLMVGVASLVGDDGGGPLVLIGILLTLVVGAVAQILTVRATTGPLGVDAGAEFVPAVQAALPKFVPVFLTSLLVQVLVSLGMFFLIVPGVFLAVMLLVSTIACILEDRSPVEALKRSRELTRGNRWRVLGLVLILALLFIGVGLLVAIPTAAAGIVPGIGALVGRVLASAAEGLLGVFVAIILTHAFLELRRLNEASAPAPLV
jgi:polyferredoxin